MTSDSTVQRSSQQYWLVALLLASSLWLVLDERRRLAYASVNGKLHEVVCALAKVYGTHCGRKSGFGRNNRGSARAGSFC